MIDINELIERRCDTYPINPSSEDYLKKYLFIAPCDQNSEENYFIVQILNPEWENDKSKDYRQDFFISLDEASYIAQPPRKLSNEELQELNNNIHENWNSIIESMKQSCIDCCHEDLCNYAVNRIFLDNPPDYTKL